jgi:hypothetical protein
MAGLQSARMAMLEREPQFRPLMSTWLNKCRFLDTPETPELLTVPKMAIASRFESREERLRREAQEAFDKNWDAEDKTA